MLAALNELFNNALEVLKKFSSAAASQDLRVGPEFQNAAFAPDFLLKLPKLVAAKFSPINYILNGDFEFPLDFLYSLSLNPKLYVPPISCK